MRHDRFEFRPFNIRVLFAVIAVALLGMLAACGKETPPPPVTKMEERVSFQTLESNRAVAQANAEMLKEQAVIQKTLNERVMTAVLLNVEAMLKEHADRLYLMGQTEVDDVSKLDPTIFKLFRGLDGGVTYTQLRGFMNFYAKGMADRRVSGVPGTENS